jgi:hypothetical protein
MQDPRTPEIMAWVDAMPLAERLTVIHAMSFAFPTLKNDRDWRAKVSTVLVELKPTKRQHEAILINAGRMSGRLKRALIGDDDQ